MKHRLREYALIAEIISALAIVISLLFVGFQMQQGNRLAKAEAFRTPVSDLNALNASFTAMPEFQSGFRKVFLGEATDAMSPSEQFSLNFYFVSLLNIYDQIFREIRAGILEPDAIENFAARGILESPYFRENWPRYKNNLSPDFVVEFENIMKLGMAEESRFGLDAN